MKQKGELELSGIQRFFKWIFPVSLAESMEKDSRKWMMQCKNCQFEKSIWEHGGIRWKAKGNSLTRRRCESCGKMGTHQLHRKD